MPILSSEILFSWPHVFLFGHKSSSVVLAILPVVKVNLVTLSNFSLPNWHLPNLRANWLGVVSNSQKIEKGSNGSINKILGEKIIKIRYFKQYLLSLLLNNHISELV